MSMLSVILLLLAVLLVILRFFLGDGRLTAGAVLCLILLHLLAGGVTFR